MGRRRTREAAHAHSSIAPAPSTTHLPSRTMSPAEQIYEHFQHLPEAVVAEVLDFVEFLEQKHQRRTERPTRKTGSAVG